jgi:8-oxo-dGTP pyrophosphatase MutT (NUDIX family)
MTMKPGQVRPIAICILKHKEALFVGEHYDSAKGETFYRPLGGRIEFRERGSECVVRELREEMGAEIKDLIYLGAMENIFTYNGRPGHEIVLLYQGKFVDPQLYERESVKCRENGEEFLSKWKSIADFKVGKAILYPEGLLDFLEKKIDYLSNSF